MFENFIAAQHTLNRLLQLWPVIPAAFIVSILATLVCEKTAIRFNIVDKPDNQVKTHKKPTPYLGGIAIYIGLAAGIFIGICFLPEQDAHSGLLTSKYLMGILAAGAVVCLIGCIDDIKDIRPWQKIIGQVIAGLILVGFGIRPHWGGLFDFIADPIIVLIFVLGATNSLNLLDGLDGLCGGVTAIMSIGMLFLAALLGTISINTGDYTRIILSLALIPSVLGFLIFNRPPARIFMGDAGSLLLGLIMAALMITFSQASFQWLAASVVIFGLPIVDTATAFIRRIVNKRPLFISDRGHIYDQMMDRGIPLTKTVILCYFLAALYDIAGLAISQLSGMWAFLACLALAGISLLIIWKKGYLKMAGLRGMITSNSVP